MPGLQCTYSFIWIKIEIYTETLLKTLKNQSMNHEKEKESSKTSQTYKRNSQKLNSMMYRLC